MTSQINPNNINGSYPVAGQDNSSQGFRDNFTNTRTNFQFAAAEISDLQAKALLKAPLTGTSVVNNNMNGTVISNAQLQSVSTTAVDLQDISGTVTLNYAAGQYQYGTAIGNVTLAFSSFPVSAGGGTIPAGSMTFRITITNTNHTLTLPSQVGNLYGATSVQGIQGINNNVITFAETGTYEFLFESTSLNSSSMIVTELTRPRNRYVNPLFLDVTDSLAANGNLSLATTTSIITSNAGNLTGNLLDGVSGQIKIIAYGNTANGDATINVSNAAWGGGNVINFVEPGDAATLQYIGGKWYVIGINNATTS